MTIHQLENTLRGSFHDGLLHSFSVDLSGKTLRFQLDLCVGDPDSPDESIREAYQSAEVILTGLEYFSVDPPDPNYSRDAPWQIDLCESDPEYTQRYPTPEGCFAARFYSSDTNAFIHFAATSAAVTYKDVR